MGIQDRLSKDPNKGWQPYLNAIDHQIEDDADEFSRGLLHGEAVSKNTPNATELAALREAVETIQEEEYTIAFVFGAIEGVLTERTTRP